MVRSEEGLFFSLGGVDRKKERDALVGCEGRPQAAHLSPRHVTVNELVY